MTIVSVVQRHFPRSLSSLSKHISNVRTAARVISSNQGLRLFLNSRFASRIHCQPDVYRFAAYLGQQFGCTHVIAVGTPSAKDLIQVVPGFEVIGITHTAELGAYRRRYGFATWFDLSPEGVCNLPVCEDVLSHAVIVCTNVIEQLESPLRFLHNLKNWLNHAPVCILTSPDRELNCRNNDQNSRTRSQGKWNLSDLDHLLKAEGLTSEFIGLTASDDVSFEKSTILAVITRDTVFGSTGVKTPSNFRVVAFMAAYNEEDIVVQSIKQWTDQGINVHILENWSTDSTYDLAKQMEAQLPVTVERFPSEGPSQYFNWGAMLERIESLSREIKADWFVRRGADEVLTPPWPGMSYRDCLYLVDQAGFNCLDHTVIEFHPVDDGFEPGTNHEEYFKHFDFEKHPSISLQRKAWKNCGRLISTVPSGGHDIPFEGRRIYPFKFLAKHYPVRSQKHGEKKIFQERKARWNPAERAKGWHIQYDAINEGHNFLQPSVKQTLFDETHFNQTYLVERLSGIGVLR